MDEDKLQAFLGAICTAFSSKQSIEETHFTSSPQVAGGVPISFLHCPDQGMALSRLLGAARYCGKLVLPCFSDHRQQVHHDSSQQSHFHPPAQCQLTLLPANPTHRLQKAYRDFSPGSD